MPPVTHIIVGTKAQFIKIAPIAHVLTQRHWPYRILDLGQHGTITPGILRDFGLAPDIVHIMPPGMTVASYAHAGRWTVRAISKLMSHKGRLRDMFVMSPPGIALIHGDTLSTVIGLYLAKRLGLRTGLVEAGLTSQRLFEPFPEEWIRRHVENRVDLLFAPDDESANHLRNRRLRGRIVNTGYNTGKDSLLLMAERSIDPRPEAQCAVLTLHRAETLGNKVRLTKLIEHVTRLAQHIGPIRFYLHEPTRRALERNDLLSRLELNPTFELKPLADYPEFIRVLASCSYILTDGGSIQEEASYLGKPCLILRRTTERQNGVGANACIATLDLDADLDFLRSVSRRSTQAGVSQPDFAATNIILDNLYPPSNPNDRHRHGTIPV
jgi:UDP-N-acetylglucosamine 2-epimerase (non-hydrolysing)